MLKQKRDKSISTKATEQEKDIFQGFCRQHGMSPSEMIRLLISKVCTEIQPGELPEKEASRKNKQMIITWHVRDWGALGEKAKQEGITRQEWIRKKVRHSLHKTVPISEKELLTLAASNRELNAIGRNLNQIARRLNESGGADNPLTLDYLQNFSRMVDAHTDKVGAVIREAHGRFGDA